ncbi:MAG: hypothetical protein MUP70_11960, partial [Candidatus Aminicenantes bacterium]|nr:hypothetical protein [Candidatus Aminicenantes bacterium]
MIKPGRAVEKEKKYSFNPIGIVHSPFISRDSISRKRCLDPDGFIDIEGEIEIFPEYSRGLKDVEGFSHLIVLF